PDLATAVDWVLEGHARLLTALLPVVSAALKARVVLIGGLARAGKTSAARGLQEHLQALGRTAHVVSLDGWLRPVAQRPEDGGVLLRYNLDVAHDALDELRRTERRVTRSLPVYDRATRLSQAGPSVSVGQDDTLIVEGVPALIDERLLAL